MSVFVTECLGATTSRAHNRRGGSPAMASRADLRWNAGPRAFAMPAPIKPNPTIPIAASNGDGVDKSRTSGLNPAARPFFIAQSSTTAAPLIDPASTGGSTAVGEFAYPTLPASQAMGEMGMPYGVSPPLVGTPTMEMAPGRRPHGAYFGLSGTSLEELHDIRRVRATPYRPRMLPRPLPIELHATIWTQNASPDPDVADSSGSNGHAVSPRNLTSREEGGGEHGPDAGSDHHGTPEQPFSRRLEQVEVEEKQRRLSAYRAIMERWYRHLQALLGKTDIAMHVIVPGPCPKLEDFRNLRLSPEKYELTVDEEEDALREWSDNCLWWWGEIKMLNDKTASAVNVAARANAPFQTTSCSPDHMTGDRGGDMFVVTSSDHVEPLWFNHPPPYLVGANANGGDGDLLLMETLRGSQQGQLMLDEDKLTEACGRQLLMEIDEDEE